MPEKTHRNIMVLMGPTASGKSAMALAVAKRRPAVIINADAMQMVSALRVLTARPTVEEEAEAPHALYGVLPPQSPTSVAVWLSLVEPVIRRAWEEEALPVLVGGTGMYIRALQAGLAHVPDIPEEVRQRVRNMPRELLHPALQQKDPAMAAKLKPGDTQRLLRALEVVEATGVSLEDWQRRHTQPLFPGAQFSYFYAAMPRAEVYARIDRRFEAMMQQGALAEVQALLAMQLDPELPIMRAHGVPELAAYLRGELALAKAIEKGQQNTRNYAKRQMTWLRNQLPDAVPVQDAAALLDVMEVSQK